MGRTPFVSKQTTANSIRVSIIIREGQVFLPEHSAGRGNASETEENEQMMAAPWVASTDTVANPLTVPRPNLIT